MNFFWLLLHFQRHPINSHLIWYFCISIFSYLVYSLSAFSVSASQRDSSSSKDNKADAYGKNALELDAFKIGPYFDKMASKNVTALLGKTAYLTCRVKNLGNKTVSSTRVIGECAMPTYLIISSVAVALCESYYKRTGLINAIHPFARYDFIWKIACLHAHRTDTTLDFDCRVLYRV